ncbi:hypothetical protein OSTOST_08709 [Ostertagia ostertagi]
MCNILIVGVAYNVLTLVSSPKLTNFSGRVSQVPCCCTNIYGRTCSSQSMNCSRRVSDFWKVRLVSQNASGDKIYFFPSLLEWLKERPQCVLNSALVAKEIELGIQLPDKLAAAAQKEYGTQGVRGDPVTSYIGGYVNIKPSTQDLVKHLQRSYLDMYERNEHCPSRELVSLIDASLLLGVVSFAQRLSEENNYEHDLLQLHHKLSSSDIWDEYKTLVMLRLSRGGAPSPEMLEAATITSLMCDIMAGPSTRRMSAIAQLAVIGLKLDAMVLAKLYFPSSDLCEQLSDECSSFFEDSVNSEAKEIAEMIGTASKPFFNQHLLRFADQVGRLEISKNVRYVIAHALAYRNFEAIALITEDAVGHLDKYSFFTELEQIVATEMLSEASRMIFHAKPASAGWKKQRDEGDKLGCALQQHPNGYFGGLIDMWIKRGSLIEITRTQDTYRQHSLLTSIEGIASVLRSDDLLNPICRTPCSEDLLVNTEAHQKKVEESVLKERSEGANAVKRKGEEEFNSGCRQLQRRRVPQEENMPAEIPVERAVTSTESEQNSEMNDNSSVAPSRSVCEQKCKADWCDGCEIKAGILKKIKIKEEPTSRSFIPPPSVAMDSADQSSDRRAISVQMSVMPKLLSSKIF